MSAAADDAPAAVPYRVKNTFVEPLPEDEEKALRRSNSWSVSSSHSHSESNKPSSSDSTQAQFFSTSHAEQSLQGINNDTSDDERETAVQQAVPSEREQQAPARDEFSSSSRSLPDSSSADNAQQALLLHEANKCVPCVRLMLGKHCESRSSCSFCHFPHEERSLVRPTKELRLRCKQSVTKVNSRYQHDKEAKLEAIQNLLANQGHHIRNYTIKLLLGEDEDKPASSNASRGGARTSSSDRPLPVGRCGAAIVEDAQDTIASKLPAHYKKKVAERGSSSSGSAASASKMGTISRDTSGYQGPVMPGLQNAERPSDQRIGAVPQQAQKVAPGKIGKGSGKLSL